MIIYVLRHRIGHQITNWSTRPHTVANISRGYRERWDLHQDVWRIQLVQRMTGPGHSHKGGECDERLVVLPLRQGRERIRPSDEEKFRPGVLFAQVAKGVNGVRWPSAAQVNIAHLQPGIAGNSSLAHGEPVVARRCGSRLQRLGIRGDEKHGIEPQDKVNLGRGGEVPNMDRIKGPAQEP